MAPKPKKKNAVAKKKGTAVGAAIDFSADAGMGLENADKDTFAIPFLGILQGLSPQLDDIDKSKPGLFFNSVTNDLYGNEVEVIMCGFQRQYLCWAPRDSGGGFKGSYNAIEVEGLMLDGMTRKEGRYKLGDDDLVDTRIHYLLVREKNGSWKPAVFSLSKTQIKKSKRWMAMIQNLELEGANNTTFNPPSFSHTYLVTTVKEKNDKGSWWGFDIELGESLAEEPKLYNMAKKFGFEVNAGTVVVADRPEEAEKEEF